MTLVCLRETKSGNRINSTYAAQLMFNELVVSRMNHFTHDKMSNKISPLNQCAFSEICKIDYWK